VNEFLQGGTMAYPNYKKLGIFLERWLVRNGKRSDDAICCIQYIGETSRSVEDQFLEEDNPKKRDGAGLQWEFFQWFGITIKFAMGYVALGNGQSKFIEAFDYAKIYDQYTWGGIMQEFFITISRWFRSESNNLWLFSL
jgi:hypothetical protein